LLTHFAYSLFWKPARTELMLDGLLTAAPPSLRSEAKALAKARKRGSMSCCASEVDWVGSSVSSLRMMPVWPIESSSWKADSATVSS